MHAKIIGVILVIPLFLGITSIGCNNENNTSTDVGLDEDNEENGFTDDGGYDGTDADGNGRVCDDEQNDAGGWIDCETIGCDCLPTDSMIFVTYCIVPDGGTPSFVPAGNCGRCNCGFIYLLGPCADEEGLCQEFTLEEPEYCASGKRILCAREVGEHTKTRIGCCDDQGNVYCERDPRPNSNRCQ
jgi:hypothetical protein